MTEILVIVGALVVVGVLAVIAGGLTYRWESRRRFDRTSNLQGDGVNGTLSFIGGVVAIILGLLVAFSVDDYQAARETSTAEAISFAAAIDASSAFQTDKADLARRNLICLMRANAEGSWLATASVDLTGDDNANAWAARTRALLDSFTPANAGEDNALSTARAEFESAMKSGQERLLIANNDVPQVVWIILLLGVFALVFLQTLALARNRVLLIAAVGGTLLVTATMMAALQFFSEPFSGMFVNLRPNELAAIELRLQDAYPDADWSPCERLAEPTAE